MQIPTNVGDLSDTSEVSLRYFEVKTVTLVLIMSDPYLSVLPLPWMGKRTDACGRYLVDTSATLVGTGVAGLRRGGGEL